MIKKCRLCGKDSDYGNARLCKVCNREYQKEYRAKNREKLREKERLRSIKRRENPDFKKKSNERTLAIYHKIRHDVIMAYGGYECVCCGETEPAFMTIDHINNDGAEHRNSLGFSDGNGKGATGKFYRWLRDNNYPEGIQVLCFNCNIGKFRNKGICPHKGYHTKQCEFGETPERTMPSEARKGTCND